MKAISVLAIAVAVVATLAWGAVTVYDDLMPVGRMWETPAVRPHEKPMLVMDGDAVPASGGDGLTRAATADTLQSPFEMADPVHIAAGAALYQRFCSHCHGSNHDGNGTVGQSFAPLPGDLRSTTAQSTSPGLLFWEISYGKPGGRQPALASTIAEPDRWKIVAYVKSLGQRSE